MSDIQTSRYARKPFEVDAVQVTEQNIEALAMWCGGQIMAGPKRGKKFTKYISVNVHNALNERQTRASVGDWILKSDTDRGPSFKVYSSSAFANSFVMIAGEENHVAQVQEIKSVEEAPVASKEELVEALDADPTETAGDKKTAAVRTILNGIQELLS